LPDPGHAPLAARQWQAVLRFELKNIAGGPVEIGALGMPISLTICSPAARSRKWRK